MKNIKQIIEIGLCRKRGICALCGNKMDIKDYNIQLCKECRIKVHIEMKGGIKNEKEN
jgi:hypothetical protein